MTRRNNDLCYTCPVQPPYTYPNGTPLPVGIAIGLAVANKISTKEAIQVMVNDWWKDKGDCNVQHFR